MQRTEHTADGPLTAQARWLAAYDPGLRIIERGRVVAVGDGIAQISGLPTAAMDDVLDFEDGSRGVVFDLNEQRIGAVLLHATDSLTAGTSVHRSGERLSLPVGDELLGRVIDPLGIPLDAGPVPDLAARQPLDVLAPPIVARDFVRSPLYTGIKIIDTLLPIGNGQRQLILGDDGLGRTSLAIDAVINQRDKDVYCVYVLVGQKRSSVTRTIDTLRDNGALSYTTVVVSEASSLPGMQYLAPFAGCAVAEFWMQLGRKTLIIYDDLSSHAKTYRALSLLLRRPPGREAYPGDIFSVHARLLERATCLNAAHGGGSMTALPIVETNEGAIASYIPTNLISITDGQIYLERELFSAGFRPAIDIARSVSRIGGAAQHPKIKAEAGRMKLDYLQFLELEVFTRFGARLEASMEAAISRGRKLREILKQEQLAPLPAEFQLAWLIAFNDRLFTDAAIDGMPDVLSTLRQQVESSELTLDSTREEWSAVIAGWFDQPAAGAKG